MGAGKVVGSAWGSADGSLRQSDEEVADLIERGGKETSGTREVLPVGERGTCQCGKQRSMLKAFAAFAIAVLLAMCATTHLLSSEKERDVPNLVVAEKEIEKEIDSSLEDTIRRMQSDVATLSIEMMQNDTVKAASESFFVDIGPFVDMVDKALDVIGVRGVYGELFELTTFAAAQNAAAELKGLSAFSATPVKKPGHQPFVKYKHVPNDREYADQSMCPGCLWWFWHWVGAITADKLIQEGSLRIDGSTEDRMYDAPSFLHELQRMQRVPEPDIMPFHAQHGFDWHYVVLTRPDLNEYPTDLAKSFCGNLVEEDEYVAFVSNDIGRECRHGFGHVVFYLLAMRDTGGISKFNVRLQLRPAGGYVIKDADLICEGYRICDQAPSKKLLDTCLGGMKHSAFAVDSGYHSEEFKQKAASEQKRCREKQKGS